MFNRTELKTLAKNQLKKSFAIPFLITLIGMILCNEMSSINLKFSSDNIPYYSITIMQAYNFHIDYYLLKGWMILISTVSLVYSLFIANPLKTGLSRFFMKNTNDTAHAEELFHPFKNNYIDSVKLMFHYNLRIFLYTLLLIIPGIIKSLEYTFVPYIVNDYPELDYKEILDLSSEMTNGLKWDIMVLSLSFILWNLGAALLAPLTLGLSVVAVQVYTHQTNAYLYQWVKEHQTNLEH